MLQYLRCLHDADITPEAYLIEMLVETLAEAGEMSKLQQIVTYRVRKSQKPWYSALSASYHSKTDSNHLINDDYQCFQVINDSKPLAFLLLSYEARCSTLFQSGVDILARNKASDEIVEVMLEKKQIVDAFRWDFQNSLKMNKNDPKTEKIDWFWLKMLKIR